ncbi:hypothetical protein BASA83_013713 [Batrachochytrium salamandrivorans]|nr:hypothetical protein BASA83_013713 [Batrachochytrium salamandrivorans]
MNSLFRHMISKFVLVYLDDIVVYSDNLEDHKEARSTSTPILKENNLFCKAEKCHFYQTEIKYLGYIISPNGTSMDPSKISAVQDWPAPKKAVNFKSFRIHEFLPCSCFWIFGYHLPLDKTAQERTFHFLGDQNKKSRLKG